MTISEMIKRADTIFAEKRGVRSDAADLWESLSVKKLTREDLGDIADLFIYGCAIFNRNWECGNHYMTIAKQMSEDVVEDPIEFYDMTVRHLNDKLNEKLNNK